MLDSIESNPILDRLPAHLKQYIKPQDYQLYTSVDQAVWRYVMRKNVDYLKEVAHSSYLSGLMKTGINLDRIPSMYGMNRILKEIGWAAAAVDGLIPSDAFMEFQAYNVLVIASDIRSLEQIQYTPSPDIIHESAGHAPILANPEYAEYLRRFGQIGCKAISSALDSKIYEAVRIHAALCEQGKAKNEIAQAEQKVVELQSQLHGLSEMTQIRNLHWWTVEYGLIGNPQSFSLYGAGLLSSIGESKWCQSSEVPKFVYSADAAQVNFDVTQPQPQLFVTPDFAYLSQVLEEFANTMAIRKGGLSGVEKLIASEKLGTVELSTGIQISGIFERLLYSDTNRGQPAYIQTKGPTAFANREQELIGHSQLDHATGIGFPIGKLKGINLAIEDMSPRDLNAYKICEDQDITLQFESGVKVKGHVITGARNVQGKIQVIYFKDCTVTFKEDTLFSPSDGIYHMPVGKEVISAYAGPADLNSFNLIHHTIKPGSEKPEVSAQTQLYDEVRKYAAQPNTNHEALNNLFERAKTEIYNDWLFFLDLFSLAHTHNHSVLKGWVMTHLNELSKKEEIRHLIVDGISMMQIESFAN